ncbi:MAG: DUF2179 domain-containing protein [Chloroflexi bacterium]|jgi:uncharacterized protein YebE (UPF0316 family)|nr:DUF2179 domain-containing protein [Chloroflexota bacterium]MBV6437329.1 hypothetical protein [Anaerolineae bacterium]MDL1915553.1 DUF2179 domain-containing protein [Anaerolineae bacterium CFX4]OQY86312.1 MAG: hypothetical protein B6D42_01535 [Anaerolineae bacterium UTCFX5]MBW7878068.1 DUF2179 domain-containing protein [Anaerolineae bacterium]
MTITVDMLLAAGAIFLLRVLNYAISTIRMVAITRGRRLLASGLAFIEAFLFAVVIASIVTDISSNVLNLIAYCLGAAAGGWVGMALESRFITSYMTVSIIPRVREAGHAIAVALRDGGYGVTETLGEGLQGTVTLVRSVVSKRDMQAVLAITRQVDNDAFVSVEETQAIYRGWQKRRAKPGGRIVEA